jgi:hypothetical protein
MELVNRVLGDPAQIRVDDEPPLIVGLGLKSFLDGFTQGDILGPQGVVNVLKL